MDTVKAKQGRRKKETLFDRIIFIRLDWIQLDRRRIPWPVTEMFSAQYHRHRWSVGTVIEKTGQTAAGHGSRVFLKTTLILQIL